MIRPQPPIRMMRRPLFRRVRDGIFLRIQGFLTEGAKSHVS